MGVSTLWTDPSFIHKILHLQIHQPHQASNVNVPIQFFDRSPLCTYALCIFLGHPVPLELMNEISDLKMKNTFQHAVFFIENLGFIECTNARKISFDEALRFEELHIQVYQDFGYELVFIPRMNIGDRVQYIIDKIPDLSEQFMTK